MLKPPTDLIMGSIILKRSIGRGGPHRESKDLQRFSIFSGRHEPVHAIALPKV
jgi:hypothetical protein